MRDLTEYAPIRVALTGAWRIFFGALLAIISFSLLYLGANSSGPLTSDVEGMQRWVLMVFAAGSTVVTLVFLLGGVGRIICSFSRQCYFRAGAEGFAVRLPKQGWFGRFRLIDYQFRLEEIEGLIHFTRSMNLIPVARELHIRLYGGKVVVIERFYFSASIKRLRGELIAIRTQAGK